MKTIKFEMQPIDTTHSTVTLVISDGNLDDQKSELLHIRMNIEHHANPLFSTLRKEVLLRARSAISLQFEEINKLPEPLYS